MPRPRKLTDAQIIEIKKYLKENKVKTEWLCNKYGITKQYINNIKNQGMFSDLDKYVN